MSYSSLDETLAANPNSTVLSVTENNEPERLQLYRNAISDMLADIFSTVGVEEFSNELETRSFYKEHPNLPKKFHTAISQSTSRNVTNLLERQIKYDELEEKFARLKKITDSTPVSSTPAWRPTHNAEENIRANVMQNKLDYLTKLKDMVSKKEDAVNKLQFEVDALRSRANAITDRLSNSSEELDYVSEEFQKYNCMENFSI